MGHLWDKWDMTREKRDFGVAGWFTGEVNFRETYLIPALTASVIEMTIRGKPTSSKQKYRLTQKGRELVARLIKKEGPMGSKAKPKMDDLVRSIGDIVKARDLLARQAERQYAPEVEGVLRTECRDPNRIEHLLDGILDFCFDPEMLCLYKKLCRYYFIIDPEATASYANTYRERWDEQEGNLEGER
jgi:hypothetical protein